MGFHTEFKNVFDINVTSIIAAGLILMVISSIVMLLDDMYVNSINDTTDEYHTCKEKVSIFFIVLILTSAFLIVIYEYWSRVF